jgi:hypothetical protein
MPKVVKHDDDYVEILLKPLRESAKYTPKFGQGRGVGLTLDAFKGRYGDDSLYSWIGFDDDLLYAAHKAAGGMTSLYRQLGIGCERLFRRILQDEFGLSDTQVRWSYTMPAALSPEQIAEEDEPDEDISEEIEPQAAPKSRKLTLDGRIALGDLDDGASKTRVQDWLGSLLEELAVKSLVEGAVFEVRQGYKSKDAKRQNGDLANAVQAYTQRYLPVLVVISNQIDEGVASRYRAGKWGVLRGDVREERSTRSTFAFCRDVVGYDLQAFFERNQEILRKEVHSILAGLLRPS